jgi:hypothetical protein
MSEQTVYKGWFVRHALDHDGTITLSVVKRVSDDDRYHGSRTSERVDSQITVPPSVPWWQFWKGNWQQRRQRAEEQAMKRAWTLNQQFKLAKNWSYDVARKQAGRNPHDE